MPSNPTRHVRTISPFVLDAALSRKSPNTYVLHSEPLDGSWPDCISVPGRNLFFQRMPRLKASDYPGSLVYTAGSLTLILVPSKE